MADLLPPPSMPPPPAAPVGPPAGPPPTAEPPDPRRRRLMIALIVVGAILAVVLIIGVVVTLASSSDDGSSSGEPFELDAALTNAADTSAFDYTMSLTVADEELISLDGVVDGDLTSFDIDLGVLGIDFLTEGSAEVIIDGGDGVLYINAGEVLPPAIDLFLPDVEWLSIDIDALVGGSDGESDGSSLNPLDLIDGLDVDAEGATDLGIETIDGVETNRYQFMIETTDPLGSISAIIETLDDLGLGIDLTDLTDLSMAEATVDVWVTEDDQVRRVAVGVADEQAALVIDIESSGDSVEIELPAADDVFDVSDLLGF
jgi:hypothetical protein